MKVTIGHADTCLPSYWGGHHKCHIAVPVCHGMTACQLRDALKSEIALGALAGNDDRFMEHSADYLPETYEASMAAIEAVEINEPEGGLFQRLDKLEDGEEWSVYAYFVLDIEED